MIYTGEQNLFNQLQNLYQTQMWALEKTIKPWQNVRLNLIFSFRSSRFLQPLSPQAAQQLSEEKQVSNGGYFTSTEPKLFCGRTQWPQEMETDAIVTTDTRRWL